MNTHSSMLRQTLTRWLPVIFWAGIIFLFSTDIFSGSNTGSIIGSLLRQIFPTLSTEVLDFLHWLARKFGHFGEYFILAVLIMRALRRQTRETRVGLALALTTIYAVSDELHQSMVPSRTASAMDVLIDVFGGFCGIFWFRLRDNGKRTFQDIGAGR